MYLNSEFINVNICICVIFFLIILIESVRNHEVQTSLSVMKENVQIQFKESGLSYMEKLLLKKYKRYC